MGMLILGIETSCDETAAALVKDGQYVRSNVIASSCELFKHTGGVVPEAAARQQVELMLPVLHTCLESANTSTQDIDAIAVTRGPGLLGSLIVGTTTARVLASLWEKPLVGIHHTLGHLSSPWLTDADDDRPDIAFPVLTLSASGGHTELWLRRAHTDNMLLGRTRDDAAGEAFDKGASLLGLPYPGGPSIARAAEHGDTHAFDFPLPLAGDDTLDFSFSGLKTALRYTLRNLESRGTDRATRQADLAASYQEALCAHLVDRVQHALQQHANVHELHVVGGVSANARLRTLLQEQCDIPLRTPPSPAYCTDNAAMIAAAGAFLLQERGSKALALFETNASLPADALCASER